MVKIGKVAYFMGCLNVFLGVIYLIIGNYFNGFFLLIVGILVIILERWVVVTYKKETIKREEFYEEFNKLFKKIKEEEKNGK